MKIVIVLIMFSGILMSNNIAFAHANKGTPCKYNGNKGTCDGHGFNHQIKGSGC